jgi:hypothetical protein
MNKEDNQQKNIMMQKMMEMCANMTMEECQAMMSRMRNKNKEPNFNSPKEEHKPKNVGTPELQSLFFEWCDQIKEDMKAYAKSIDDDDLKAISAHFKLSVESCEYLLKEL